MTHTKRLHSISRVGFPFAFGMAISGLACSSRDDVAEPAAETGGESSGSSGDGSGGAVASGGTMSSGGSQGGVGGTGGSGAASGMSMGGSATGGTPTGGASGAGAVVGCDASNTTLAPADGLVATFMGADGISGQLTARGMPTPTYDNTDGALHIAVNAPAGTSDILVVSYQFENCIDATAFAGIEFSVSGSLASCPSGTEPEVVSLGLVVRDSAHTYDNGTPFGSRGTGPSNSIPWHVWLTSAQVTAAPQTVRIPFDFAPDCCQPATPLDLAKLLGVGWTFVFADSCVAEITIDDVRFY